MVITSKQILTVLQVLSWIIFIGLCVEVGGFIFSTLFALTSNPFGGNYFWDDLDMTGLLEFDRGYFMVITFLMILVTVMRALMFYLIIRILHEKKFSLSQPFNENVRKFIILQAYLALGIGIFSSSGRNYSEWLISKGVIMPNAEQIQLGGADVWLFMAVILFVIAYIFKRGIEIQTENELTI